MLCRLIFRLLHNYGLWLGYVLVGLTIPIALLASTFGFDKSTIQQFDDLPAEFDGYRIIYLTDAPNDFITLLEHDPTSWRRHILSNSHAQLTLSVHTHVMQFGLFGWSPSKWIYPEWRCLFTKHNRQLYVSSGVSGLIPFRFGMLKEIVVITLQKKNKAYETNNNVH